MSTVFCPNLAAELAAKAAIDQKGLDVKLLHLGSRSDVADYFLIVSGTSERHVKGIVDRIMEELKKADLRPYSVSGYETGSWVTLDYFDVVVHIFYEPSRHYYQFDELWGWADIVPLPEQLEMEARRLRTGMVG